jgi:uncharacterized SAM-binding protein YcdF (DUF218 family)
MRRGAAYMPRAVGCFRRAGFTVTAYPVDYRTGPGALAIHAIPAVPAAVSRDHGPGNTASV